MAAIERKKLYGTMWLIRLFEEKAEELVKSGEIYGTTHLYIGEEAIAAGVIAALEVDDIIVSNHRNHGHCMVKTGDVDGMMAEMMGRSGGLSMGLGGSIHMADFENGHYGSNGIVGADIAIGAGIALAQKRQKTGRIVVPFFGDGATNTGNFHETMNIAKLQQLPVLFVCENNGYGISTKIENSSVQTCMKSKAEAYGIAAETVDGNDVLAVRDAAARAADDVRNGRGPRLIEAITYRWSGHSKSDRLVYREHGELDEWMDRCPIRRRGEQMRSENGITGDELMAIEGEARQIVERAVKRARLMPVPDMKKAESCV